MLVSAISMQQNVGYGMSNSFALLSRKDNESIGETSFNSLTPYTTRKTASNERMPQMFDNINEWKNFCHRQILGGKLNIIA